VLPDADCGAGNKVQIAAYQEVSDVKRQQIVLNPQDNIIMGPQISTLVFQEQSTLPLSDALSSVSQILQIRLPKEFVSYRRVDPFLSCVYGKMQVKKSMVKSLF
jgi:hypothetical protein